MKLIKINTPVRRMKTQPVSHLQCAYLIRIVNCMFRIMEHTLDLQEFLDFTSACVGVPAPDADSGLSTSVVDNPMLGSPIGSEPRSPGTLLSPAAAHEDALSPNVYGHDLMNENGFIAPVEQLSPPLKFPSMLPITVDAANDWLSTPVKMESEYLPCPSSHVDQPTPCENVAADNFIDDLAALLSSNDIDFSFDVANLGVYPHVPESQAESVAAADNPGARAAEAVSAVVDDAQHVPDISDQELVGFTVKQLNSLLKRYPQPVVARLKQRRRTLKNRGYAQNCRTKRNCHVDELEKENSTLRKQLHSERAIRVKAEKERDVMAQQLTSLKQLLVAKVLQNKRQ